MRGRISKAKAFIALRNYSAAIYELENIRKETSDTAVQAVVNVLLMNSYLEQGDYKRAQDFLNTFYAAQKTTKPNAAASYMSVAGQVVKGARSRVERYKALGLNVADHSLPQEALNDLDKMRETLELVITQSKEMGVDKTKAADAMALLEEASSSRSMIARDDYDAKRWRDEVADTRESMANSRSTVLSAVTEGGTDSMAQNNGANGGAPVFQPVSDTQTRDRQVTTIPTETNAKNDQPTYIAAPPPAITDEPKPQPKQEQPRQEAKQDPKPIVETPKTEEPKASGPVDVGSLVGYATKQQQPVYPQTARSIHMTGIVRIDVTIDENGEVAQVQKTSGPILLQSAAKDAILKWKFRPVMRDGQAVKANGYIAFNFN